jgi:hypothetical protein
LEVTQIAKEAQQIVSSQIQKPSFPPRPKPTNFSPPTTPLKIQKLTKAKMVECQLKGLCYNCDEKYFPGHKYKEQNIFMAMSEDVSEEEAIVSPVDEIPPPSNLTPSFDPPEVEPMISLNSLTGFSTPQTLKLISYIKNRKVIMLMDNGSTHNFIHRCISQEFNWYIRVINNFQIMISKGGSMKCGGHCENMQLQIGQYHLKSHIFAIDMSGCDIFIGAKWLRTLDPIFVYFKDLTMQFQNEGKKYTFQGIIVGSYEIISSHRMENPLKKGHSGIISQLHFIHVVGTPFIHLDLQSILSHPQVVFTTSE